MRSLTLANLKAYWPILAGGGVACVVVYGLGSAMYHVTSTFLSLDFKHVFYIGFVTGGLGALMLTGGGIYARRLTTISTQTVHKKALSRLARSPEVRAILGPNIKSGHLRAYTHAPGHMALVGTRIAFVEPHASMLFQVVGDRAEGMATVEAVKHKGGVVLNLLAVDTLATPGRPSQLILAVGSEDKLHVRGTLRGFLQTERAAYIPQDREAPSDAERLEEQQALPDLPAAEEEEGELAVEEAAAEKPKA